MFGFSTQTTEYQKEMVARLHVPFEVLSDVDLGFVRALRLPTFDIAGMTLVKRLTLVIARQHIEKVFYPIFPPDKHAAEVIEWLRSHPAVGALAPLADAFGVALVEEGIALRGLGIENPILVFGGVWTRQIPLFLEHGLTITVPSLARLRDVEEAAAARHARARVHLKIDTGMERIGVHHYNAEGLLEAAAGSPYVDVLGIYSHFANADAEDLADARRQLARFEEALRFYERRSLPVPQRHIASSAAILRLPESHLDLADDTEVAAPSEHHSDGGFPAFFAS